MLGQFLEFSISTGSLGPEHQFYRSLGFQELPAGDVLDAPYVALWDGSVTVGLHTAEFEGTKLTFVRPELDVHLRALKRLKVEFESVHTADDEFNYARFVDPNGQLVELVEARTHSPAVREASSVSACGSFLEYSLPTSSVAESRAFWEPLGFTLAAAGEAPHPWARLAGHGIAIGLHELAFGPGLSFVCPDFSARKEYLTAKGIVPAPRAAFAVGRGRSTRIRSPGGSELYLFEAED
jgi:hypothetical protein